MGNGAKAQMKRDKNAAGAGKGGASQLKTNTASQSIQCKTCFQTFQSTAKVAELTQHAENKHSNKAKADCFPGLL
ncbi:hypothetical protein QFC22_001551 [Naganishia vaughanmartiniae]|uniref:Uncharacterized protein n=1 Tax=Naganishia vaughanmartiniae TaxID=1424756 RepID=A0ACC2XHE0_9TREE|nr:hypothetical protein QFC22_001551 [Naganishia vaughanmartiniae]